MKKFRSISFSIITGAVALGYIFTLHPLWAAGNMTKSINGKPAVTGVPGTFVSINRKWKNNDNIS